VFSDPKKNIYQMGITEGMHVADFGSGSGHYTLMASKLVGDKGRVYAIDIQSDLLKKVKNLSRDEHRDNIETIPGDIDEIGGSMLSDGIIDIVILSNVLFQLEKKENTAKEIKRVLKSSGRVIVIDWTGSFGGIGPQQKDVVGSERAKELFEREGFVYEKSFNAGEHHYGLIFKRI